MYSDDIERRLERLEQAFASKDELDELDAIRNAVNNLAARIYFLECLSAFTFADSLAKETLDESAVRKRGMRTWISNAETELLREQRMSEQQEASYIDFCRRTVNRVIKHVEIFEELIRKDNLKKAAETK